MIILGDWIYITYENDANMDAIVQRFFNMQIFDVTYFYI